MKILLTGSAGFVGYHLSKKLINHGHEVYGIDSLNSYYDPQLKIDRINNLKKHDKNNLFIFEKLDIANNTDIGTVFKGNKFELVINLAAQAGVRYSLENPSAYLESNINGFFNILENIKKFDVKNLIYASSSSVYGSNEKIPFATKDNTDNPVSIYAATKKSNEMLASAYSHLHDIKCIGLRFFTVYGPFGRPDMAYYSFTRKIDSGEPINVFNNGNLSRDFTYIDDIVNPIIKMIHNPLKIKKYGNNRNHIIYNIGNNKPVNLSKFIKIIEMNLNKKAKIKYKPMQPGDVYTTYANIDPLIEDYNYQPKTNIDEGLKKFIDWYRKYHKNYE